MKYKAIIFDLDGVTVFTDKYHYLAWKAVADQEHIYFDETINNRLRGVSRMDSLDIILEKAHKTYTQEEKEELATQKNNIYRSYLAKMGPDDVSKEVRDTLTALKKADVLIALGSSSKNAKFILNQVDLLSYFDKISDGNNITKSKPDPEVFLKARDMLGLKSEECVVMEDAIAGIDAGNRGEFDTIGILDASHYEKSTYKVESFKEILNIVL